MRGEKNPLTSHVSPLTKKKGLYMQKKRVHDNRNCCSVFFDARVLFLVYPKSVDSSRQAKLISKWSQKFSELEYMFSVYRAQKDGDLMPN